MESHSYGTSPHCGPTLRDVDDLRARNCAEASNATIMIDSVCQGKAGAAFSEQARMCGPATNALPIEGNK